MFRQILKASSPSRTPLFLENSIKALDFNPSQFKSKLTKYQNKLLKFKGGKNPSVGYHSAKGGREYQEDRLTVLTTTKPEDVIPGKLAVKYNLVPPQVKKVISKEYTIISVFDGHGGSETSEYLNNTLPDRCKIAIDLLPNLNNPDLIASILETEFIKIDNEAITPMRLRFTGSTGVMCIITNTHIIVANVADSPAILFNNYGVKLNETTVHNCDNPLEEERIDQDDEFPTCLQVSFYNTHKRLKRNLRDRGLDMTRAFGDWDFKPKASAIPQLYIWNRVPNQILCVCSDSFFERKIDGSSVDQDEQDIIDEVLPILQETNFDPQISASMIVERRSTIVNGDNTSMVLAIL